METTQKKDFIEVYILKTLNEIKSKVKNNIKLTEEREKETDQKMASIIRDLIESNANNLKLDSKESPLLSLLPIKDEAEIKKIKTTFILYYTALYYDSVDLLHRLLKENIKFEESYFFYLQFLDKNISSKFDIDNYIEMLKVCPHIFRSFHKSIDTLPEEEKEQYRIRFKKLITMKYGLIKSHLTDKSRYHGYMELQSLFDKSNLDIFTDESYEIATIPQLELINFSQGNKYHPTTRNRLNYLIQHKNYSNRLTNLDTVMPLFTDEELVNITYDMSSAIGCFSQNSESLNKILELLRLRPDLAREVTLFSQEEFEKYDLYTIIEVCNHLSNTYYGIDNDIEISTLVKMMKPKSLLKRVFGAYKKED